MLAESVRVGSCYADPRLISRVDDVARRLSPILKMPVSAIAAKIRKAPGSFVWLARHLPVEQAQALEKANLLGVGLQWEYKRFYPNGDLASHLLGYVGGEGQGLSGTERIFNDSLLDTRPPRHALRDGRGTGLSLPSEETEGKPGGTYVRLTIDRTIQYLAEKELEWGMKRSRAKTGMIVVQDPHTGEILAAASRPNLELTAKTLSHVSEIQIPAVHAVFEPGSTFKVVLAAAALEEGTVKPGETFYCENGEWRYRDLTIHDHSREKILTFAQVIERSSNIGTAKVALRLGKEKFYDYVRAFGFGTLTGSEIPGESAGLLKPIPRWSGVSLPITSFGQEVSVTALQLACAYSAIANGGVLLEPRLFVEAVDQIGGRKTWETPTAIRRVISEKTAARLRDILQGVVLRGTGKDALLDGWTVAGKTGTAQKIDPRTRKYSADKFVASFCGFVPAVKPRLTIVVVYDEPQGVSWGGYNAGPVFRNVAWHAMTYLGVSSDKETRLARRKLREVSPL